MKGLKMYEGRNPETLTEILDEIIYEYNLGYEAVHEAALRRVIELIKQHDLDEAWSEANGNQFRLRIEDEIKTPL
jgi:hypothetical protein